MISVEHFEQIAVLQISKKHKIIDFILGLTLLCVFVLGYINLKKESSIVYKIIGVFLGSFMLSGATVQYLASINEKYTSPYGNL